MERYNDSIDQTSILNHMRLSTGVPFAHTRYVRHAIDALTNELEQVLRFRVRHVHSLPAGIGARVHYANRLVLIDADISDKQLRRILALQVAFVERYKSGAMAVSEKAYYKEIQERHMTLLKNVNRVVMRKHNGLERRRWNKKRSKS